MTAIVDSHPQTIERMYHPGGDLIFEPVPEFLYVVDLGFAFVVITLFGDDIVGHLFVFGMFMHDMGQLQVIAHTTIAEHIGVQPVPLDDRQVAGRHRQGKLRFIGRTGQ